jgi:hypothetical protein
MIWIIVSPENHVGVAFAGAPVTREGNARTATTTPPDLMFTRDALYYNKFVLGTIRFICNKLVERAFRLLSVLVFDNNIRISNRLF